MSDVPTLKQLPQPDPRTEGVIVEEMLTAAGSLVAKVLEYRTFRGEGPGIEGGQAVAPIVMDQRYVVTVRLADDNDVAFQDFDEHDVPAWVSGNWPEAAEGSEPG